MKKTIALLLLSLGCLVSSFSQNGSNTSATDGKLVSCEPPDYGDYISTQPSFPGGFNALYEYLAKNIHYPDSAKKVGIEGKVIAGFVVDKDGRITDVQVLRSLDPACDAEVVRLVKNMPRWSPGKRGDKPVRVRMTLPVSFKPDNN